MQRVKLYKLQKRMTGRSDKKERIRALSKNSSHFRNVQIWPREVSVIFKIKKCTYQICARLKTIELFMLHLLVYLIS